MITFVLDASVALKWAMPAADEPLTAESLRLLKGHVEGEIEFIVPDVFWAEVANVLWKGARRGRWGRDDAEQAIRDMQDRNFVTISSVHLLREAISIAFTFDRAVYNSLYVGLAVQAKVDLITADERLANSLAARFPVKWLGAF